MYLPEECPKANDIELLDIEKVVDKPPRVGT